MKSILVFLFVLFFFSKLFAQDSLIYTELVCNYEIPSTSEFNFIKINNYYEYKIEHDPSEEDEKFYKKHQFLISSIPNEKNHENYYILACSAWNLGKIAEAEKLFLTIIQSNKPFYTNTYHHSSDIPGDKSSNTYGYGSFTSNYKNYAARYLCEIYLEKKDFTIAKDYLFLAKEKYPISFNCGTGHNMYQDELDRLEILCLQGQNLYEEIIHKYLNKYSDDHCANLVNAIKQVYTKEQIFEELIKCETTLQLKLDDYPSQTHTYKNYGKKDEEKILESEYYSGEATIILFGQEIVLERPILKNGEILSEEIVLQFFRESPFYKNLNVIEN